MAFLSKRHLLPVTLVLWLAGGGHGDLLSWIWGAPTEKDKVSDSLNTEQEYRFDNDVPLLVQYEGKAEDKKFVDDVMKYTFTSQSESEFATCHRVVMAKIKESCVAATEEDLSKLSVNMLNCHSEQSGKGIFPCTEKMTLMECTQRMDADMWTAYHVMNLRTRALCYTARQHSLHDKNREKVNQLAEAVQHQFLSMLSAKERQNNLEMMTYGTKNDMSKTKDVLELHAKHIKDMKKDVEKMFGITDADLVRLLTLADDKRKLYFKYRRDVTKNLESIHEKLKKLADAKKEDYSKILSATEMIKTTVESTFELAESKVIAQQELVAQLIAEREGLLDTLSSFSTVMESVEWLWQIINDYMEISDEGKLLDINSTITWHWLLLFVGLLYCMLGDAGILSHVFTMTICFNLLNMKVYGKDPAVEIHVLIAVVAFLKAVHWFAAFVYSFLPNGEEEEGDDVYISQNKAFVAISKGKGVFSSTKESATHLIDKLWQHLQTIFEGKKMLNKPYDYNGISNDEDENEDDKYSNRDDDLLEAPEDSMFVEGRKSVEHGSSLSRPFSSIGRQLISPFDRQRTFELGSDHSRRSPTPLKQSPDRMSPCAFSPVKPVCSATYPGGTECRKLAQPGQDTCYLHGRLSSARYPLQ